VPGTGWRLRGRSAGALRRFVPAAINMAYHRLDV
jgi:hypothetical protein